MTLLEEIPSGPPCDLSTPVLETKRLALRAPTLADAKTVAALADDRRIAENTARIPHPYREADAEGFIAGANKAGGEAVFLITLRDGTVIGQVSIERINAALREARSESSVLTKAAERSPAT